MSEIYLQSLLIILLTIAGIYVMLRLGNLPIGKRHQQFWSPATAFVMSSIAIYYYIKNALALKDWGFLTVFQGYVDIAFSLAVIFVFALAKLVSNGGGSIGNRKKGNPNQKEQINDFSFAYKLNDRQQSVLRKEWVFPKLYLKYLSVIVMIWFACVFIYTIVYNAQAQEIFYLPALTPLSILIILESYWYLEHNQMEDTGEKEPETPEETIDVPPAYYQLWEEYQQVWADQLLLAWHYKSKEEKIHQPAHIDIMEAKSLQNAGFKLSVNDYSIIQNLVARKDLVIDEVISDKVAPLLFNTFLRRLMEGENILILTPQRCYANSVYHQKIVDWIDDWLYMLTGNKAFWRVKIFSKVGDIELSERIIVSSADDLLEKNVVNYKWFEQLHTILYISGEQVFSETLAANNALLNILRSKNQAIQCIVLADYRTALDDSVARNLNIQQNLEEVRINHHPPQSSFLLFWKLEGEEMFQHKVFSGFIGKNLGAEAVLSLLPRRERKPNIVLVGQDHLPYYDNLSEIDNNKNSLRTTPVAPRTLRYKATEEVHRPIVETLLSPTDNNFLFARDTDYNLISTLRKWHPYATKNAFVHVVSPPYLLRAYLTDNAAYFMRTPIYPLSSKIMISRFEVARTLLEKLVHRPYSEQEILEELVWIFPNAQFVKSELHKLFRLAFKIDIIASNYLSVRSTYEFDKQEDKFKNIVSYQLSPQIKDNINLSFLRYVQIVDKSRNVLEVIGYDFLFQNYLPGQIHAFGGKAYHVSGFDRLNNKLRTDQQTAKSALIYRPNLLVTLEKLDTPLTESHKTNIGQELNLELCEGTFDVQTRGYYSFSNGISLQANDHTYTTINENEVPIRHYPLGRCGILTFNTHEDMDVARITATLTALLHEALYSLFPETRQYVIVGSPINELIMKGAYNKLFPSVMVKNMAPAISERVIQILLIEDAHQDLGIIQSIFDQWTFVLQLLDDYLVWLLDEETDNNEPPQRGEQDIYRKTQIDKTNFLKYGLEEFADFIDLKNTSKLLRELLGRNYMTSQRNGFYSDNS